MTLNLSCCEIRYLLQGAIPDAVQLHVAPWTHLVARDVAVSAKNVPMLALLNIHHVTRITHFHVSCTDSVATRVISRFMLPAK